MARLRISCELLVRALFPDQLDLVVQSASFDPWTGDVLLELSGSGVPDVQEFVAVIHGASQTTVFKERA